ncbi:MAG: Branched-chain amino acid ATP-binding cassette transporter, partial [Frankiaceae bacterium]|nr:Branched-chain amino acid ATP-binding cassette transporter [Frankiaceae bacterium]
QGPPREVLADERVVAAYLGNDPSSINRSSTTPKPRTRKAKAATR